jgi:hypothetical protein
VSKTVVIYAVEKQSSGFMYLFVSEQSLLPTAVFRKQLRRVVQGSLLKPPQRLNIAVANGLRMVWALASEEDRDTESQVTKATCYGDVSM